MDLAELAIRVDTSDLERSDRALMAMSKAAEIAERSAQRMIEQFRRSMPDLDRLVRSAENALGTFERTTGETGRRAAESANSYGRAGRELAEMSSAANKAERSLHGTSNELDKNTKASGNLIGSLQTLGTAVAGLGLASAATDAMNAYREFEKLQGMLKTATGSTEAAGKAFADLQKFASTTPYELAQAVEGFVKLKNLGLDPSISSLTSYGNTAAAMGKDLMQMIEAVADASTGEFERLKEFGIKASKEGDRVSLTFQGVTTTIGNSSKEIQGYLLNIGNVNFASAMSDQANTLNGKISNLKDSFAALQVSVIQQSGAADMAKASIAALSDIIEGLADNTNLLLVPVMMVGAYFAGKGLIALQGYIAAMAAKNAATYAAIATERASAASALAAADAEMIHAKALLAQAQASVAATSGMARLTAVQTTLIPAQVRAAEATAAHTAVLAAQSAASASAGVAARALSGALAIVGGPLGALVISVGTLAYGLSRLSADQSQAGKSIKDLSGSYINYNDVTKTALSLNTEYLTASAQRKEAILAETSALKSNVQAEIDVLKARLQTLKDNYSKAVLADAADPMSPSLAGIYDKDILAKTAALNELENQLKNVNTVVDSNAKGVATATGQLVGYKSETDQAVKALEQQSTQLSITKQDQDLAAESFRKAVDVLRSHEDALKSTVESLQKQRIELEQGKAAAEYYTARLNGLTDAEAKAAAGANQYNVYLQERKRLQQEQAGLSGGLMDAYSAKLGDLGLGSLNFDGVVTQTDKAVTAADSYSFALQNADEAVKKLGASAAQTMQTISTQTGEAVKITAKQVGAAAQVVAEFQKLGWSREQALGIAANLKQESEFRTNAVGDGGRAYGIAQWHPDRQANFAKAFGKSIKDSDLLDQIKFVNYELTKGSEQAAGRILKSTTTAAEAARAVSRYYERPLARDVEMDRRAGIANALAKEMGGISTTAAAITTETAKTTSSISTQITAVKYLGQIDGQRVTDAERQSLIYQYMGIEAQKLVKSAQDQIDATTQNGLQLRANQLTQQQFSTDVQREILARESMADYLAEERKINLDIAAIKDPSAPLREELAQKKLNAAQIESLVTLQQKAAVLKQLDDLQTNTTWVEREIQATQQGVAAMNQLTATREADNLAKQAGVTLESALGQQILASVTALQAKQRELQAIKQLMDDQKTLGFLDAEITATRQGSAALAEANLQKDIRNKLDQLGLTQESELGKRIAETTRQLAAKNKELQIEQTLRGLRTENAWLEKEIAATQQGEKALKALNIQKRISEELDRQGIAAGTQAAAQITNIIQQQEGLKEKLASIQELRQPISQFFNDVLSGGKNAFKNLGDWISNWLKKIAVEFATNKIMLSLGLNAGGLNLTSGASGISGLFSSISGIASKGLAGLGTALSGGLSGIMGSIGSFVSAIPGWGWALAGVAGLAKLFGGPSAPKINLTQGATAGQGMLTDGQQHYTKTALGTVGATDSSYKIGREKGFVPKLHEWFKWVESFDAMVAKTLPNSIGAISEALKGVEMKGANLEAFTRQRLHTIFSALPEALQVAIQGGKNIMAGTTEEIAARFAYMSQVAESGLIPALEQLGLAGTQTKESMIAFAMSLADSMGGIDAAKAALDNYYQAAYTDAERLALTQSAAKTKIDEYNKSLSLSGAQYIDTIAELRAYIEAQDANTEAGRKAIAAALGMTDAITKFSGTAEEAAAKLKSQWSDFNNAAYTDAQKQQIAQNQAKKSIDAFNQSLGLTGNKTIDNIIELRAYMRTLDGNTEAGRKAQQAALGMTSAFVAFGGTAEQIKQKIAGLREGIKGLVGNLYGSTSSTSSTASQATAQSALDAANSTLEILRSRYDDEKQRIDDLNSAAQEAHREELARYEQLKQVAVDLREYLNGFKRSNALLTPLQKLQEIQSQYNTTLAKARTGDVDSVKNIQGLADELRQSYLDVYASSKPSQDKIAQILADLGGLAGVLDGLAGTAPTEPASIGSTTLASLEQQIKMQEATISNLQTALNNANSSANATNAAADRVAMAKELATKVGELGLATDKSAWQILAANGVNIKDLAKDFGINVDKLDGTFVKKVAELSGLLGVNSLQLLSKIGVSAADLALSYGINVDKLDKTMIGKLGELASQLGVNGLDMAKALGLNAKEIAAAYGLNTDKLNQNFLTKLDSLADILKVSSVDLASKLGINTDKLGDLMANKLASLPGVPDSIKAGLAPYLQNIRDAADPATLKRELQLLQGYVNTLPPDIKGQLNAQLAGILGYTGDTKTNTGDTKTETMALRNVSSRVTDLTVYTRDELTGRYITKMLQNSRALNQNAANIGKSTIPSFAIGSDRLPRDMMANVHAGEMIFTAPQSNSMRELALYNQSVIPQISEYLSEIAANESQSPVFIQPVVNPIYQQQNTNESNNEELISEVRLLRKEVAELRKDRSSDARVDHDQRSVMINQNQESLNNQSQERRDKWRDGRIKQVKTA